MSPREEEKHENETTQTYQNFLEFVPWGVLGE